MYARLTSAIRERRLISGIRNRYSRLIRTGYSRVIREPLLRAALDQRFIAGDLLPSICFSGDFSASPMGWLTKCAFDETQKQGEALPQAIRAIEGMSGQKYRSFINRFVRLLPDARYLEVGSWAGSTAVAALYGNKAKAVCIDNWSQFGGPKAKFAANIESIRSSDLDFSFIEQDFRAVDYACIGTFNVYLFDGPHGESDQYDGVLLPQQALAETYLLVVDDWNWLQVRVGTLRALKHASSKIECSIEIRTSLDNSHPQTWGSHSDWHNGYFIAVIRHDSRSKKGGARPK
jgi:hypothetical protein